MLIVCLRANSLYTRKSFEHAVDALLTSFSSDSLTTDDLIGNGLQHQPSFLSYARAPDNVCGAGDGRCGACPTVLMASKKYVPRPHKELIKMDVTLVAMATIPQIGWTNPVAAAGIPMPLNKNARDIF